MRHGPRDRTIPSAVFAVVLITAAFASNAVGQGPERDLLPVEGAQDSAATVHTIAKHRAPGRVDTVYWSRPLDDPSLPAARADGRHEGSRHGHDASEQQKLWGTNGRVDAIARSGNTLYLGGYFSWVGPNSGGGVPVAERTGEPLPNFPVVDGRVYCVLADGTGGWYIGGAFIAVAGLPRSNLAHVEKDGRVADWSPDIDGTVQGLALAGHSLYVGGVFSTVGGAPRGNFAAVEVTTGAVQAFRADADANVEAIVVRGHTVYAGGRFAWIGGVSRSFVAAFDASSGAVTDWNPGADVNVLCLALHADRLFAGGYFTNIGGQTRKYLAELDLNTGKATSWDAHLGPQRHYIAHGDWVAPYVASIDFNGGALYFGGDFETVGDQARMGLAAVDLFTAAPTAWNPTQNQWLGRVNAIAVDGGTIFVGGYLYLTPESGRARANAMAFDASTGALAEWNPVANEVVAALSASHGSVYMGGRFNSVWDCKPRNCLAALDLTTGRLTDWNPAPDGYLVSALHTRGGTVFAGGAFSAMGGQSRQNLAAIDARTGAPTAWRADADQPVLVFHERDPWLYVGGEFTHVGGEARNNIAALDPETAVPRDWVPALPNGVVNALAVSANTIYAGGNFRRQPGNHLAAFDEVSGLPNDEWNPAPQGTAPFEPYANVYGLDLAEDTLYVAGTFVEIGGTSRANIAAVRTSDARSTSWNPDAVGPCVVTVAAHGGRIYAGGAFDSIGGAARRNLAALDRAGNATPWNPAPDGLVRALLVEDGVAYLAGDFRHVDGVPCGGIALMPADPGETLRQTLGVSDGTRSRLVFEPIMPNPARTSALVRFAIPVNAGVTLSVFDLQGRRIAIPIEHAALPAGSHVLTLRTAGWPTGIYECRLQAGDERVVRRIAVVR